VASYLKKIVSYYQKAYKKKQSSWLIRVVMQVRVDYNGAYAITSSSMG
jgi:hypothetical protein